MTTLPWFRMYHRIIDDTKIKLLAFEDRWHFVALCCLTANGTLAEADEDLKLRMVAVALGVQVRELDEIRRRLVAVNLIGPDMVPLAWDELQFESDNSTERVRKFREKQRRNSMKRYGNVSVTVQETDTDTETEETPLLSPRQKGGKKCARPDDVGEEIWADFLSHRKRKRADLTETALARIRDEADKAGWKLEDALAESVARGWQGFKAEWVKENGNGRGDGKRNGQGNTDGMGRTEAAAREALARRNGGGVDAVPRAVRALGHDAGGPDRVDHGGDG